MKQHKRSRWVWSVAIAALSVGALSWAGCGGRGGGGRDRDGSIVLPDGGVRDGGPLMDGGTGPVDMCGAVRASTRIYNGHIEPEVVPLSPGQVWAVGQMGRGCSGTLIAPTWALTATHCGIVSGDQFCIGVAYDNPNVCIRVTEVHNMGTDMTVVRLADDATSRLPGVEPVLINTEPLSGRIGERVETGGLGSNNIAGTPNFGVRYFATEYLRSVSGDTLETDGRGLQGPCGGDSGGPVFVIASDGSARVAGDLFGGDSSCVDVDEYTRTDAHVAEIEAFTGPTPDPRGCGGVTAEGECRDASTAVYCSSDTIVTDACAASEHCDFDASAGGYRCVAGTDPCMGLTLEGACEGNVARWCEGGAIRSRDCGACGQVCRNVTGVGFYCGEPSSDPCASGELDFIGRCNGAVVEYCRRETNEYREVDCAEMGQTCGWAGDELGYWCIPDDPCSRGELDYLGRCNGNIAEYCSSDTNQFRQVDCSSRGGCVYVDDRIGYWCADG